MKIRHTKDSSPREALPRGSQRTSASTEIGRETRRRKRWTRERRKEKKRGVEGHTNDFIIARRSSSEAPEYMSRINWLNPVSLSSSSPAKILSQFLFCFSENKSNPFSSVNMYNNNINLILIKGY